SVASTAVRLIDSAVAADGMTHPPTTPTPSNSRAVSAENRSPSRESECRHGVTGTNDCAAPPLEAAATKPTEASNTPAAAAKPTFRRRDGEGLICTGPHRPHRVVT